MGVEIEDLKRDLDRLTETMRQTDKDLYDKISATNKDFNELNVSVKLVVEKLGSFMDTFKNHEDNEMKKYGDILVMFEKVQESAKKQEDKYVTKEEFSALQKLTIENGNAIKEGWKLFYKVSGGLTVIVIMGSVIMYMLNLISQLQSLKGM